jgi:hypothetical protein
VIVLGLTFEDAVPLAPLDILPVKGFALVAARCKLAASGQDRLRLQVLCSRTLPSFLPLAAREPVEPAAARAQLRDHGVAIAARLAALAGRRQITVHAVPAAPVAQATTSGDPGRDWLRRRAARAADQAEAAADLDAILSDFGDARVYRGRSDLHGHVLLAPANADDAALSGLAGRLAGQPGLAAWQVSVTGPWPPFAFCALGEPGQ